MSILAFEAYFPDHCPPAGHFPSECDAYRCVKVKPLKAEDFETHYENGRRQDASLCSRCGLSVFDTLANAVLQRRRTPKIGKLIAKGTLTADMGVRETPSESGHFNWWTFQGITSAHRSAVFRVVAEDGN